MPWLSKRKFDQVNKAIDDAWAEVDAARAAVEKEAKEAREEAMVCRALLMQLRVRQTQEQGRSGFAVTAFIPQEVVERLRRDVDKQKEFTDKVARHLVRRALLGLVHVIAPENRIAMITFEPLGEDDLLITARQENKKTPIVFRENQKAEKLLLTRDAFGYLRETSTKLLLNDKSRREED